MLQSYSYGMVDETCTWNAEEVGKYTFRVTVKDRETELTETASRSINVVQKQYDPLNVKITSAPKYADIGEKVRVVAQTSGGVDHIVVSWEVYNEKTRVANGSGLTAEFVPKADGKYTVIVRAEDKAQMLEEQVIPVVGSG